MSAPPDILVEIVARRRERFEAHDLGLPAAGVEAWASEAAAAAAAVRVAIATPAMTSSTPLSREHLFLTALSGSRSAIVAEVKMGSPRIGSLAGRVDPSTQARIYRDGGAAALSVVVEPDFFGGSYELLSQCKEASGLPAIAKDFVVSPKQLDAARAAGADAILLIASLYSADDLRAWAALARGRGLVPLIETHDAEDRAKLEGSEWELVGVNNRDLRTFEVDLEHSIAALPELPASAIKVAESGISSGADVARLAEAGFDAFLVGESLLLADDPAAKLAELRSGA